MRRLILPRRYYEVPNNPVIFLAGPMYGSELWQETAARLILKKTKDIVVVSPRKILYDKIPYSYLDDYNFSFYRQRPWEKYYMKRAAEGGTLMFWMPEPEFLHERLIYGATTRFELGEWMTRYDLDNSLSVLIGAEEFFPTLNVIKYDKLDLMGNDEMYESLEELVDASIEQAYIKYKEYKPVPDVIEEIKGLEKRF